MRAKKAEHDEQVMTVRWFDLKFPEFKGLLFAIPNGGQRHVVVASKLKAEGVRAGVPDLFLPVMRKGYGGMFIEMKSTTGKVTPAQKVMISRLQDSGYRVEICHGFVEAELAISEYMHGQ